MSKITVAMLAADFSETKQTIESILRQESTEFDLIVAGANDVRQNFDDARIRWVASTEKPAYFYNVALDRSAEFFATIQPGVVLLPAALSSLICALQKQSESAAIQSFYFQLDEKGKISRVQFRKQREFFIQTIGSDANFHDTLLVGGVETVGHFCIYRKSALQAIGRFSEKTNLPPDYEALLRISESLQIKVVPQHPYSWRGDFTKSRRWRQLLNWCWTLKYILLRQRKSAEQKSTLLIVLQSFTRASGLGVVSRALRFLGRKIKCRSRSLKDFITRYSYEKILIRFPTPRLNPIQKATAGEKRIAYYIWHFPVLSQTFVNRELSALKKSEVSVRIIADEAEAPDLADENARSMLSHTRYLLPMKAEELRKYKRFFFFRNPIRYLRLFSFVITHRYGPFKNRKRDFAVFSKAVYLAGILKHEKITHLHSPWTDRCAFLSLLASKLLGIPYSVQSRAHEIHRTMYLFGLRENLRNAHFVITNSEYNRSYLQSIIGDNFQHKVVRIYNGVDLERFHPSSNHRETPELFRLLCVARLIEQKGLLFLLRACRLMKDQGLPFHCEIIGGPEEELFLNYLLEARKLFRKLDLANCVTFTGMLPFEKVLEKYKNSDIFIMPSVIGKDGSRDITPNSLIEAMAMRLPVVSTTVTAIPEIIENGVSGLLVPPADENALADAITRLMTDAELRKQLGENARKTVETRFDISANVRHYIELFSGKTR
jgi:colanic acid/amylovoran biosynthesis glycosyltransferase